MRQADLKQHDMQHAEHEKVVQRYEKAQPKLGIEKREQQVYPTTPSACGFEKKKKKKKA